MSVEFAGRRLVVPAGVAGARSGLRAFQGRTVILGIRPEDMDDAALVPGSDPGSRFPIVVDLREGMGSDVYLHFTIEAPPVFTEDTRELASDIDEKALEELKARASERRTSFVARAGPETRAAIGETHELHVDTRKLYFFDPATGMSIYDDRTIAPESARASLPG
jgi:multiple sugar transport system ATP-binding protein